MRSLALAETGTGLLVEVDAAMEDDMHDLLVVVSKDGRETT
jgi:hypothetical protein